MAGCSGREPARLFLALNDMGPRFRKQGIGFIGATFPSVPALAPVGPPVPNSAMEFGA